MTARCARVARVGPMVDEVDPQELIPKMDDVMGSSEMLDEQSLKHHLDMMNSTPFRDIQRKIEPPIDLERIQNASSSFRSFEPFTSTAEAVSSCSQSQPTAIDVPHYSPSGSSSSWMSSFTQDCSAVLLDASGVEDRKNDDPSCPQSAVDQTQASQQTLVGPLDGIAAMPVCAGRETHNEKERKRRYRIKNACSLLKDLIPGLSDKTDKATVLEYTVQYLIHLKRNIGRQFDGDFLQKYSPY